MVALGTDEFVHKREEEKRRTWAQRNPDSREYFKTDMCGDQKGKRATKQLVSLGHSIYPICNPQHSISTRIRFDPERVIRPQRNRYLGENRDGA